MPTRQFNISEVIQQILVEKNGGAKQAVKNNKQLDKSQDKVNKGVKEGAKGYKAINFEFLGIMFFGQNVAKTFGDMLKPASELFGMNELYALMLQDLFLPVMQELMDPFMAMLDFFMSLPEEVKLSIGVLTAFLATAGSILGNIGTLVLGFQAISIAFGGKVLTPVGLLKAIPGMLFKGIGLIFFAVSLGLIIKSLSKPGIQIWKDVGAAIAAGLGLFMFGASASGSLIFSGAILTLALGLDMIFDSMARPGIQWWESIIGGLLAGLGVAIGAGMLAGSAAAAMATGVITIPLGIIFALTIDWAFSRPQSEIDNLAQGFINQSASGTMNINQPFNTTGILTPNNSTTGGEVTINQTNNITGTDAVKTVNEIGRRTAEIILNGSGG